MFAYCNNNPTNYEDPAGTSMDYQDTLRSTFGGGSSIDVGGLGELLGGLAVVIDAINHLIESAKAKAATRAEKTYIHMYEVHHIVPQAAKKAAPAQAILYQVFPDEGTNHPLNKVVISTNLHKSLHTNYYYGLVNYAIVLAYYSANGDPEQEVINVSYTLGVLNAAITAADKLWQG